MPEGKKADKRGKRKKITWNWKMEKTIERKVTTTKLPGRKEERRKEKKVEEDLAMEDRGCEDKARN